MLFLVLDFSMTFLKILSYTNAYVFSKIILFHSIDIGYNNIDTISSSAVFVSCNGTTIVEL